MNALTACLLPLLLGWGVLRVLGLRARVDPLSWSAWLLLASTCTTALASALWLAAGLGSSRGVQALVATLALGLHLFAWRRPPAAGLRSPSAFRDAAAWERVAGGALIAALLIVAAASVADGQARALVDKDDATFWAPKAKLIYLAGDLGSELEQRVSGLQLPRGYWEPFEERIAQLEDREKQRLAGAEALMSNTQMIAHLDYPLLNPLLQWWCFVAAGELLDGANRLPLQLCSVALLLLLAGALLQSCRPLLAAALLLLVFSLGATLTGLKSAYSDGAVALGLLVAADAVRRAGSLPPRAVAGLTALGLVSLVAAKHEGLVYLASLCAAWCVLRPLPLRRMALWCLPAVLVLGSTWLLNLRLGVSNDVAANAHPQLARLPEVLAFFWNHIWSAPRDAASLRELNQHGLLLLALAWWALGGARSWRGWPGFVGLTLGLATLAQLTVYVLTPHELEWHLLTSAPRVAWQLVPLAALWIGVRTGCRQGTACDVS